MSISTKPHIYSDAPQHVIATSCTYSLTVFVLLTLVSVAADNTTQSCAGVAAISPRCKSSQSHHQRDVFYVGGGLLNIGNGNLTVDQLYVEKLTPSAGVTQLKPLGFFHGGAVSGISWLNTPDGRNGFSSYFLKQGYQVYLLDHTSVGRSSQMNTRDYVL
ncbi:hypothetical protein OPT61_g2073 [Boeremia exigua]|uniref:Uncharacterized protein n=1 Tax=Boeremia exigua TaxID=749465 RepID=A0ACC2IN21_9PLEO|nr:hypothetical protein OPT61_g2073 [Boeremia exigua]